MAITAYSTGTSTELNQNTIDIKSGITSGDMLFWNSNTNLFESDTPATRLLSSYATQSWVQQEIANTVSGGSLSLTGYATETWVSQQIAALGTIFDGDYNSLTNLPTLFNGDYNSLSNAPSLFSGDYNDLINKPLLSSYYQTMTFAGNVLTLSNGNAVDLSSLATSNTSVDDLNDVDTTGATVGQGLRWNGSQWVPYTFLEFDGNYASLTNKPTIPNDLLDLNINDGTNGQVLYTNGAGNFYFGDIAGGGGGLQYTDLSVTTGTPSQGGSLLYSNTNGTFTFRPANLTGYATQTWVNTQLAGYATTASLSSYATTASLSSYATTASVPTDVSDLTDTTNLLSGGGGGGIALTNLSVTQNSASGTGTLGYNNTTGVFTYTPPDLSAYQTIASAFDGDYSSLTNTPTIPADVSDLTDTTNLLSGGGGNASTLDGQAPSYYLDYTNFTNTPTIPSDLTDLNIADGTNGQVLTTDGAGNFSFTTVTSGSLINNLSDIGDVSTSTPSTGQVLKWDGSQWAPASDLSSSGSGGIALSDISVSTASAGTAGLSYNNTTGVFTFTPPDLSGYSTFDGDYNSLTNTPTIPADVSDLTDTTSLLFDGDYTSLTNTPTIPADVSDLTDTTSLLFDGDYSSLTNTPTVPAVLTDLGISDGTSGQVLTTDGSGNFTFTTVSGSGGSSYTDSDVDTHLNQNNPTAGYVLSWNGSDYTWVAQSGGSGGGASAIDDLTDVDTTSNVPNAGEALVWDSVTSKWVPGSVSASSISAFNLSDLGDVSNTIIPSAGQVLKWSGTEWAPASDSVSASSGGITLSDISVTVATNFGQGNLTYNNSTGVFLFTPPDLSGYSTFSGNYADLQGLPTLFSGDYNDLTNTPATSDNIVLGLNNSTLQLINNDDSTVIDSINLNTITPYLSYNDLDDLPSLFSGNYNDLTNLPTIPSLSGYATQTYVQNYVSSLSSDNITEGGTNLYYADERVDDRVAALVSAGTGLSVAYDDVGNLLTISSTSASLNVAADGATTDIIDLSAGDTLTFSGDTGITTSVTGGTVSIDLDDTTVIPGQYGTNTQIPVLDIDQQGRITGATTTTISTDLPIAGDTGTDSVSLLTDTLTISGGTGVTTSVASDTVTIEIGQPVGTSDDVTFNNVTVSGDLNVEGTLTAINTTNTTISDNIIVLNEGETGSGITSGSSGIEIDRGTEAAVSILYNDINDQWTFGTETVESGHLIPTADVTYDLGSPTKSWNNLYLGNTEITATPQGFSVGGSTVGGEEETQSITTTNVTVTKRDLVLAGRTTDGTPTEIYLSDGSSVINIASGVTAKFKATFIATDGTDTAAFIYTGLIQNISGTTSLIGSNILETLAQDAGNDWSAEITADDLTDYLKIVVTGEASTTIDWTVFLEISEARR